MLRDFLLAGGPLVVPLLVCSIVGLTVVLERLVYWMNYRSQFDSVLVEKVYFLMSQSRITEALQKIGDSQDPSLTCIKKCFEAHQKIKPLTLESMATQSLKPTRKFEKTLETIITISPLLGILGTVLGIIISFQGAGPNGMNNPSAMMAGLSQALVTTALGLGISIVLLVFHNYFVRLSESTKEKLEEELTLFEELA